jgi:hypothetical protein
MALAWGGYDSLSSPSYFMGYLTLRGVHGRARTNNPGDNQLLCFYGVSSR